MDEGRCHVHQSSSVDNNYSNLIIQAFHYLSTPIQNEELLRKLYIERDLTSYQIAEMSGWSRTSISDALRILDLSKETKKAPNLKFGEKLVGGKRVPHKEEQKVIKKIITLRNKGLLTSREFSYHYQDLIYIASFSQSGAQVSGTGALFPRL
jgi:hypothetical protein